MRFTGRCFVLMVIFAFSCTTDFHGGDVGDDEQDLGSEGDDDGADITGDMDMVDADGPDAVDIIDATDGEEVEQECVDSEACDDGNPCNGEETCNLESHMCEGGEPPDEGFVCGSDPRSICLEEACVVSTCGDDFVDTGAGESCEPPGEGACDSECNLQCTGDGDCADDGNPCNGEEFCNTTVSRCESRNPLAEGQVCNESPRRICISGTCQNSICGDGFMDPVLGEECDDGNTTNGDGCDGDCTYSCHVDFDCDDGLACTGEHCNTTLHTCENPVRGSGTVCRPAAGPCDVEEVCDGVNGACPADEFHSTAQVCRPENGVCDVEERCTGTSAECPADGFSSGNTCRAEMGPCDAPEACDGTSRDCPANGYRPSDFVCRAAAGDCDAPETCPGTGTLCPANSYLPSGTVCRASARYCDIEEVCTGSSADCPADEAEPHLFGVTYVSASISYHTCAVVSTGDVKCWGDNNDGQLGITASTVDRTAPVNVGGLPGPATRVATGGSFSCARLSDGTAYCWGRNGDGQLGNGGTTSSHVPTRVGSLTSVTSICAGQAHACALTSGNVYCWGDNGHYQLGDNTTVANSTSPVQVEFSSGTAISSIAEIACGYQFSCGRTSLGNMVCWGSDSYGALGNGSPTTNLNYADYVVRDSGLGRLGNVSSIGAGGYHACADLTTEETRCWGLGSSGQIGNGSSTTTNLYPELVLNSSSGQLRGVTSLDGGQLYTCARLGVDAMCWGKDDFGQLGDGVTGPDRNYADDVINIGGTVGGISAGFQHTCARINTGQLMCWGGNGYGQLGIGTQDSNPHNTPALVLCE
jgi:cysteine-rich repeat protein